MPVYSFTCSKCGAETRQLLPVEQAGVERFCSVDNEVLVRTLKGTSTSRVVEIVDNGFMARRVEYTKKDE